MRKIFAFIAVSIDGYHAGPNQELDWQNLDEEFDAFSMEQLAEVDTLPFGRVTYEGMVAYWPTQQGSDHHTGIADTMNNIAKIVISQTLKRPTGPTPGSSTPTSTTNSPHSNGNPARTSPSSAAPP